MQLWQQILAKQSGAVSSPTVVAASGRLWAWGLGTTGQLGINESIAQVSSGGNHQVAITSDGRLFAWGLNSVGQLGDGTTAPKSNPVQIGGNTSWTSVSAGGSFTMAIRNDGALFAWGTNAQGQLGLNVGISARIVTPTKVGNSSWSQINAGGSHVLAIRSDGTLWSWGFSATGQLGLNTGTPNRSSPSQIGTGSWTAISAAIDHSLGIDSTGTLYGWGNNTVNQTGIFCLDTPLQHASIMMPGFNLLETTGFIKNNGQLWTMGNNDYGSLGINAAGARSSPVQVAGSWTQVAFVVWSAFGIKSGGTLWSWGLNSNGILGVNDTINRSSPIQIGSGIWKFINVYINSNSQQLIYAIDNTNALYAWGGNGGSGDVLLGDGNIRTLTSSPVQIGNASWSMISGSLGLRTDGTLWSWGTNGNGELGQNDTITRSSMTQIGSQSNWTVIAGGVGNFFVGGNNGISYFAINELGELYSWGHNAKYALGLTDSLNRSTPTKVGSSSWIAVSNGGSKSMGIDVFGKLYIWGAPDGVGDTGFPGVTTLSQPVQLAAGTSFIAIPSKFNSAKAATANTGFVFRWGTNGYGQLGLGTTIDRSSPTQLGAPTLFGVNLFTSVSSPTQVRATPFGISSWAQVSAGISHSLALTTDNRLFAWGLNTSGQLGDGSLTNKTSNAMQVPGNNWRVISAGNAKSLGVSRTGILWAWGAGTSGALGTGAVANRSVPAQIGTSSWTLVDTSDISNNSVGALITGGLFGWGAGANGAVGDNAATDKSAPAAVSYLAAIQVFTPWQVGKSSWTQVATGASHTVGILSTKTLYAWGLNNVGQLGVTATGDTLNRSSPTQVGTSSWVAITAGEGSHSVAVRSDGTLWVWGSNQTGQLGTGTTDNRSSPTQITYGNSSWVAVDAGDFTTGAITTSGQLYMWGAGGNGILGDGSGAVSKSSPTQVFGSWASLSVGPSHVLALRSDKTLWGWGLNTSGQLGDRTVANKSFPVQIGTSSWHQVSAGLDHSLGITADKKLYAWGGGTVGQTGILTESQSWIQIAQGNGFSVAKRNDGTIWSWGTNTNGPLGTGDTLNRSSPTQIGTSSWSQVFVSLSSTYAGAVKGDGSLWAWGLNSSGQLGDGTTISRSSPVQVLQTTTPNSWISVDGGNDFTVGITSNGKLWGWGAAAGLVIAPPSFSWSQISQNSARTVAIRNDGMLFTWGLNNAGQLGIGDLVNRSSPVQVGWSSWSLVSAGASHTLAVRSDGTLFAWGLNTSYQLGIIDSINRSSPTQVTARSWSQISAGDFHSTGISQNLLYAWGLGSTGQLGELTDNLSWTSIAAGNATSAGITNFGLFTWGTNTAGQIGDNSAASKSSPVQLSAGSWSQIKIGQDVAIAVDSTGTPFVWGQNGSGQLGKGDTVSGNRSTPVQLLENSNIPKDLSNYSSTNKITKLRSSTVSTTIVPFAGSVSYSFNTAAPGVQTFFQDYFYVTGTRSNWYSDTGDFTLEAWIYPLSFNGPVYSNPIINIDEVLMLRTLPTAATTSVLNLYVINSAAGQAFGGGIQGGTVYLNQWQHVAACRQGNTFSIWIDGVQVGTQTSAVTVSTNATNIVIGKGYADSRDSFYGYISNVRVVNGVAVYTTLSFARPTAKFSLTQSANSNGFPSAAVTAAQVGFLSLTDSTSVTTNATEFSYTQVASGGAHLAGIDVNQKLYMWGYNASGELGLNNAISRSQPNQVGTSNWSQITLGTSTSAAIDSIGRLFVWGYNLAGQIGDSTTVTKSSPTQVAGSWLQVALGQGSNHILGIKSDGSLWAWGQNLSSQLGDNTAANKSSPVAVAAAGTYTQVAIGDFHSLAIKSDGSLWAWGKNDVYQLGITTSTVARSSPTQVGNSSWSQVTAGVSYTLAKDITGNVYTWGVNTSGQLGLNNVVARSVPTVLGSVLPSVYVSPNQVGTDSYSQVAAGNSYTLAIKSNNTLWAWGLGTAGQLGDTSAISKSLPVQVGSLTTWTRVTAGPTHAGAINTSGQLFIWGNNLYGAVGASDTINRSSPTIVPGSTSWKAVSAGASHTSAIDSTNKLWTWGLNVSGQIGDGTTVNKSSPVLIGSSSWSQLSASTNYTGAIDSTGRLLTWGLGTTGELGINLAVSRSSPTQVGSYLAAGSIVQPIDLTLTSWSQVNAGISFTTVIAPNSTLWTWGFGTQGQLGLGNTTTRSSPSQVGSSSWSQVSAGGDHVIARTIDNTIFVWGGNGGGQLGQGNTVNLSNPTAVPILGQTSSFTAVAAGLSYSMAAAVVNGTLWGWGLNTSGQLGDSTVVSRSTPFIINSNNITPTDKSTYAGVPWPWTANGRAHVVAINPFSAPYNDTSLYGGSIYLPDLSSFYTAAAPGAAGVTHINLLADFTVEAWVFKTGNHGTSYDASLFVCDSNQMWTLCVNSGGRLTVDKASIGVRFVGSILNLGQWYHIALTRSGALNYVYLNGTLDPSVGGLGANPWTDGAAIVTPPAGLRPNMYIGRMPSQPAVMVGLISNLRFTQKNIYTGNFTVPTSPLGTTGAAGVNIQEVSLGDVAFLFANDRVPYHGSFTQISAGTTTTAATTAIGRLANWGVGTTGQLAEVVRNLSRSHLSQVGVAYPLVNVSVPTAVNEFSSWTAVSAGKSYSLAIRSDSQLFAWGVNPSGLLGTGDTLTRSSPVQIGTFSWSQINAGVSHTLGITTT